MLSKLQLLAQYTACCNIPLAPIGAIHLCNRDAFAARAVNEFIVSGINADMAYRSRGCFEKDEIAHAQITFGYFGADLCLRRRGARQ